jgi:hypothetical protein
MATIFVSVNGSIAARDDPAAFSNVAGGIREVDRVASGPPHGFVGFGCWLSGSRRLVLRDVWQREPRQARVDRIHESNDRSD